MIAHVVVLDPIAVALFLGAAAAFVLCAIALFLIAWRTGRDHRRRNDQPLYQRPGAFRDIR